MPYIKESIITELQKLYSLPRKLRAGNKLPALFLKKRSCTGNLLPAHKILKGLHITLQKEKCQLGMAELKWFSHIYSKHDTVNNDVHILCFLLVR